MANVQIKRYSGSAWVDINPKTTIGQVINLSSQLANMQSDIGDKANLAGADFTGNIKTTSITNNYYAQNVHRFSTTSTPVQTVIYTGIKYQSSTHMPVVRIYGYAYGLTSPIELKIGFYIYGGNLGYSGAVSMGAWRPNIYLFKYTREGADYVAIGLSGSCYYLAFQVDVQSVNFAGKIENSILTTGWSSAFRTQAQVDANDTIIPSVGVDNCISVGYKSTLAGMVVQFNGTQQFVYDGAVSRTLNITPAAIGAAKATHSHPTSQITNFDSEVLALSPPGAREASSIDDGVLGTTTPSATKFLAGDRVWKRIAFSVITDTPDTLSGYGITDAAPLSHASSTSNPHNVTAAQVGAMSTSHTANLITSTNIINWNSAYGWGNHASAGYIKAHPTITMGTNTTTTSSPGYAGTFTAIDSITKDSNGHVTKINTKTVTMPSAQSIPSIPSVMTTTEGNTGTATTQRTINAVNLKSIILNHSPAGARTPTAHEHTSIEVKAGQDAGTSKLSVFQDIDGSGNTEKTGLALFRQFDSSQPMLEISKPYSSVSSIDFTTSVNAFKFNKPIKVNDTNVSLAGHKHEANDITDFNSAVLALSPDGPRQASDVSAWAKKSSLEIGDIPTGTTGTTVALGNHTHSAATTSAAGLMSSADKTKLNGIAAGAQVNVGTDLSQGARNTTTLRIDSSTGSNLTLPAATISLAGLMSAADKTKLNGIAANATANKGTVTNVSAGTTQVSGLTLSVANGTTTPTITTSISNALNFRTAIGAGTSSFSGSYNDLTNKPTIPAAQVAVNWNSTSGITAILNKPNLATVATSGSYNDLSNKPTIPAAQVQSNWNATTGMGVILNKPNVIIEGDSRLTNARPASDVSAWAKKSSLALSDVPTISIAKGGTGATTALAARANLGLGNGATASNVIRQSNWDNTNKILTIEVV